MGAIMRNIVVLHNGTHVLPEMLPEELTGVEPLGAAYEANGTTEKEGQGCNIGQFVGQTLAEFERAFVEATITECNGSVPEAARMLAVSPSTLYRKREGWRKAAR